MNSNKKDSARDNPTPVNVLSGSARRRVAPPVYRPQPVPRVLQRKIAVAQSPKPNHLSRPPVAPLINRPPIRPAIAQTRMAGAPKMRTQPVAPPVYRPQAKPIAVQQKRPVLTESVVQRYTVREILELGGVGRLSQNGNYFISGEEGGLVYAAIDAAVPRNSNTKDGRIAANGKTYQGYESKLFVNDCLHTAEEIINQRDIKVEGVFSRVVGTHEAFGDSHEENIRLAGIRASDNKADPGLGHAYVIVNKNWVAKKAKKKRKGYMDEDEDEYPYHAAAVVATDGNDRVTLEVCATTQNAVDRDTKGVYRMYTTDGVGDKFHSYWQRRFFDRDSATLVIERKP